MTPFGSDTEFSKLEPEYDAIVIGSGAGGSTLTHRLAHLGRRVLVVERGDYLRPDRKPNDPVGRYLYHALKMGDSVTAVGGATKFYGSALYRLRESDFRAVAHEAGLSPAWPITYSELEPYYVQAETLYRVHGATDGDISEPPRSGPFPHPPIPHDPVVSRVVDRLTNTGTAVASIPKGIDYGPGGGCVLCGTCDSFYCQIDAKMDAETAALRPALKTGKVDLVTQTECVKVLTDRSGSKVSGVLIAKNGVEKKISAAVVAVCSGIPGSALLLRRSRTDVHPGGLGNANGMLGRYLGGHSVGMLFPVISARALGERHTKTFAINHYYDGSPNWPYPTGVIQVSGQAPFWEMASKWMRPLVKLVATHSLTCFYMTEAIPTEESGLIFDGDTISGRREPLHNLATFAKLKKLAKNAFRRAGYPVIARNHRYLWHEVGTARFGKDPRTSVTDANCMVHGIDGLFVVDASTLPSAGAVNTGLTIMALALRAGDHIARMTARVPN